MVAFPSAADALLCAVAMQQSAPTTVQGERLAIRVGLTAGEGATRRRPITSAPRWWSPAVSATGAEAGQILLHRPGGRAPVRTPGFAFAASGELELKGVPSPSPLTRSSMGLLRPSTGSRPRAVVGREAELARLTEPPARRRPAGRTRP